MRALALATVLCLAAHAAGAAEFRVTSTTITDGGKVPLAQVLNRDGCTGSNRSPQLTWSGAPAGTRSFAVTVFDRDARHGKGWWHWLLFNLPPRTLQLNEGAGDARGTGLPAGAVQGRDDFGLSFYGGPCPPPGDPPHHYVVTVYALRVGRLPPDAAISGAALQQRLRAEALATAHITVLFGRR